MIKRKIIRYTKGNALVSTFALLTMLLLFYAASCVARKSDPYESQFGPYCKPIIDLDSAYSRMTRLLDADSVADRIILCYSCKDCVFRKYDLNEASNGKLLAVNSTPMYICWNKGEHSYIKKIDQFGYYKTVERSAIYDFMIYDFYKRNRIELDTERILSTWKDFSRQEQEWFNLKHIDYQFGVFTYYDGGSSGPTYNRIGLENSGLRFYYQSGTTIFKRFMQLSDYRPMVASGSSAIGMTGSIPYGNNSDFYYHNQSLKIYCWIKLIEGQLFELEGRANWVREKDLIIY